jgi:transcriptional regulator with GAF, ATPase, and Fis domain
VLIRGASGTGKELVANALHYRSPRRAKPLVKMNCAALSQELVESELFGHERGAFTGATARREGKFEAADGGTLFLDEVGDMPLETQAKLLRAIQEKEFERVGGNTPIRVDVRLIAATNQDLESAVQSGRFREDLYYRLKVVTVSLPPLRERREDIPLLVEHLVQRAARQCGKSVSGVSEGAMALLGGYHWPGNIRELAHVLERSVTLAHHDVLGVDDFPPELRQPIPAAAGDLLADRPTLEEVKRRYIQRVLEESGGNVSRAAAVLGLDRRSLYRMAQRYGIALRGGESDR